MVVDSFAFFNEVDLLRRRLEFMDPFVDLFVIPEANITYSGIPKPWNFPKDLISKYGSKLRYIQVEIDASKYHFPEKIDKVDYTTGHWEVERFQRNTIADNLDGVPDESLVFVTDLDEIPWIDKIEDYQRFMLYREYAHLEQDMFFYNLRRRLKYKWIHPYVTHRFVLRKETPSSLREACWRMDKIKDAGWHLSYFMPIERIQKKIESFAHSEYNTEHWKDPARIQACIDKGIDLYERPEGEMVPVEKGSFPARFLQYFGDFY